MKHSRFCSKCGKDDILIFKGNERWPHVKKSVLIRWLTRDKSVHLDRFICASCGHVTFWVDETNNIQILKPHFKPHFFAPKIAREERAIPRGASKSLENLMIGQMVNTRSEMHDRLNKTRDEISDLERRLTDELISVKQRFAEISNRMYEIENRLSDIEGKLPSD